jgi:hypothetical protein
MSPMQERRNTNETSELPIELLARGKSRLDTEIKLLEGWLAELDETRKDNPASLAARKTYGDMLQSRRDLLQSLQRNKNN